MFTIAREEGESKGRKQDRDAWGCRLSIALHPNLPRPEPQLTNDSGQSFELPPNREGSVAARDFGGPGFPSGPWARPLSPWTRNESEPHPQVLMTSAPLPRTNPV